MACHLKNEKKKQMYEIKLNLILRSKEHVYVITFR